MKVGILTFHRAHNYGAVLQAYALQTAIASLGYDVEIIDYFPSYFRSGYDKLNILHSVLSKSPKRLYSNIKYYPLKKTRFNNFEKFVHENIKMSKSQYTEKDFITDGYDVIFYGSDQIWNGLHTNGFDNIFWGFNTGENIKRISYAASTSLKIINNYTAHYIKSALANFHFISTRELSIGIALQKFTGKRIHNVLDPVFLLKDSQWDEITTSRKIKDEYVLVYQVRENPLTLQLATAYAKRYNLRIVQLTKLVYHKADKELDQTASPEDFVSYIKYAKFVFTTSFHGTAFSILYHKNFYTISINEEIDERSKAILNIVGLRGRLISETPVNISNIDYSTEIRDALINSRNASFKYIKESLTL